MAYNYGIKWAVSHHAVDRYISRAHIEGIPRWEAKQQLLDLLKSSKRTGENTKEGDPIYASEVDPTILMVVKENFICVTVLPLNKITDEIVIKEEISSDLVKEKIPFLFADTSLDAEISALEIEMAEVDAQKKALGEKKNKLHNQLVRLKVKKLYEILERSNQDEGYRILGLSKKMAQDKAEGKNLIFRLIRIDGENYFPYPDDKRGDRVCVEIDGGKVSKVSFQ